MCVCSGRKTGDRLSATSSPAEVCVEGMLETLRTQDAGLELGKERPVIIGPREATSCRQPCQPHS